MTTPSHRGDTGPESGWAIGGLAFAGSMLILVGMFQTITGLTAIFDDNFFVVARNYTFDIDTTVWGWIHLVIGILMAIVGFSLFSQRAWAGITVIILCGLSAVVNFFFIPYYPFWSILMIAIDVWVIWAVTRPGAIRT